MEYYGLIGMYLILRISITKENTRNYILCSVRTTYINLKTLGPLIVLWPQRLVAPLILLSYVFGYI